MDKDMPLDAVHPQFGRAEYVDIVNVFKKAGFVVISEKGQLELMCRFMLKKWYFKLTV